MKIKTNNHAVIKCQIFNDVSIKSSYEKAIFRSNVSAVWNQMVLSYYHRAVNDISNIYTCIAH